MWQIIIFYLYKTSVFFVYKISHNSCVQTGMKWMFLVSILISIWSLLHSNDYDTFFTHLFTSIERRHPNHCWNSQAPILILLRRWIFFFATMWKKCVNSSLTFLHYQLSRPRVTRLFYRFNINLNECQAQVELNKIYICRTIFDHNFTQQAHKCVWLLRLLIVLDEKSSNFEDCTS